ncbi:MAG: lipoate--protein ligase family protein [Candidatus Bathyarchaeia archaeon]
MNSFVWCHGMGVWRLIPLEVHSAALNMAVDEVLLGSVSKGDSPNTVRFYRWRPSAVSIGYFQSLMDEVDLEMCRRLGVDVVRRITGGGAVYHDFDGEVTYSVIAREDSGIPRDIPESYKVICNGIIKGLGRLGLKAEFKPVNDVVLNGRKVSGNAQTRRMGCILQHGTILVDLDLKTMFQVLKVGGAKISDKALRSVEERVTSIRRELGRQVSLEEAYTALREGFREALKAEFKSSRLNRGELEEAERLAESKYGSPEWLGLR